MDTSYDTQKKYVVNNQIKMNTSEYCVAVRTPLTHEHVKVDHYTCGSGTRCPGRSSILLNLAAFCRVSVALSMLLLATS